MERYFATFVAGAEEIIAARLRQYPNTDLKVQNINPGVVVFDSGLSQNQLSELRWFNNVYKLLPENVLPQLVPGTKVLLRARVGSQPAEPPAEIRARIQKAGYELVAHRPDTELLYWQRHVPSSSQRLEPGTWQRDEGQVFWGQLLPRAGFKTRKLEPGELRPELAHILGLAASVDAKDVVIDPFAGYGGIVREMLQGFHCKQVIAVERNEHLVPHLKSIPGLVAFRGDAGHIEHVETHRVDRVITDLPWGDFSGQSPEELKRLYHAALIQMHRVLRLKGCAVILTAVDFLPALAAEIGFTVEKQYSILVSGKKATIYKLRKT